MFTYAAFEINWALLSRERVKKKEKKTLILTTHKTFMKTHIFTETKHQFRHNFKKTLIFELKGVGWDLSMIKIRNKLTKRTTKLYKNNTNNEK